jgi:hypothetical protein
VKLPEEYWSRIERNPLFSDHPNGTPSLNLLRRDIERILSDILLAKADRALVWRGQANADFGLSSSLFRKALTIHSTHELSEKRLFDLEYSIINYSRRMGLGKGMTNVQLLHALQHYELPTRLIDVSRDPLSALWFASNALARKDGRLFLFAVPQSAVRSDDANLQMVPWAGIKLSNWTNKVLLLNAPPSNPRMAAQDGAFLVGGLARNYAGQQRLTKDKTGNWCYVPAEQIHEISEVFIKFPLQITPQQIRRWNVNETYGVTWRIPHHSKGNILRALKLTGIAHTSMYPNFEIARDGLGRELNTD